MMEKEEKLLMNKAEFYYECGKQVHVTLKTRAVRNGMIKETSALFFILDDKVNGEMPVFFSEVYEIEPYKERGA